MTEFSMLWTIHVHPHWLRLLKIFEKYTLPVVITGRPAIYKDENDDTASCGRIFNNFFKISNIGNLILFGDVVSGRYSVIVKHAALKYEGNEYHMSSMLSWHYTESRSLSHTHLISWVWEKRTEASVIVFRITFSNMIDIIDWSWRRDSWFLKYMNSNL